MKKLILFCIYITATCFSIAHHSDFIDKELDVKRYEDLWSVPNNKRFLEVILDPGYNHPMQRSEEEWINSDWAMKQKEKAFPLLLEILRREPSDQESQSVSPWLGVARKGYALNYVLRYPEGNLKPFVKEVRIQLPFWLERKVESGMNSGFIREALKFLSLKGDASDIPLIEGFLEDPNRNNRSYARKNLAALKERLAKELDENRKDRVVRGDRERTASENKSTNSKSSPLNSTPLDSAKTQKTPTFWYIVSALGVIFLMTLFQFWKRKP